jgi:hypothetical protein
MPQRGRGERAGRGVYARLNRGPIKRILLRRARALLGLHPRPPEGVKFAVFLWAERVAAHLRERRSALKLLICPDVAFFDRVAHHGAEDGHLEADGGVAHLPAQTPLAVLAPPGRIIVPAIVSDQMDLGRADIKIETRVDDGLAFAPAGVRHLAGRRAPLLLLNILLGDFAEGAVEDRNVMLDAEAQVRVVIVGAVTSGSRKRSTSSAARSIW